MNAAGRLCSGLEGDGWRSVHAAEVRCCPPPANQLPKNTRRLPACLVNEAAPTSVDRVTDAARGFCLLWVATMTATPSGMPTYTARVHCIALQAIWQY